VISQSCFRIILRQVQFKTQAKLFSQYISPKFQKMKMLITLRLLEQEKAKFISLAKVVMMLKILCNSASAEHYGNIQNSLSVSSACPSEFSASDYTTSPSRLIHSLFSLHILLMHLHPGVSACAWCLV
jgi:hypothetical protein